MNADLAPVNWIFMMFLVLLVFGAIAAIIWRSWIVGGIVLVLILLAASLMYTVRVSPGSSPAMVAMPTPAVSHELDPETLKSADVHPSLIDAARALAARIPDELQRRTSPAITRIHIVAGGKQDLANAIRDVLREHYSAETVVNDTTAGEPQELRVDIKVAAEGKNQRLRLVNTLGGSTFELNAGVMDAPWVKDLGQYVAENPDGQWIVGRAPDLFPQRETTIKLARDDAAAQMVSLVKQKFPELSQADPQWLRLRLEQELALHKFIKQEFVQRVRLSISREMVYRADVLVDASTIQLEQLNGTIVREHRRADSRIHRFGGGLVALGVLICLLYLFLNRATRGYFQMNLRLAATMALVAGVLLVLLITG